MLAAWAKAHDVYRLIRIPLRSKCVEEEGEGETAHGAGSGWGKGIAEAAWCEGGQAVRATGGRPLASDVQGLSNDEGIAMSKGLAMTEA